MQYKILLADDDCDDCLFFNEIIEELPISAQLETLNNGIHLMNHLSNDAENLPQALFLDLNMPLKDGIECLTEIKSHPRLKKLPVIMMSTSLNLEIVESLYEKGASYYICKPGSFPKLKRVIHEAITRTLVNFHQPQRADFIIQ